MQLWNKKIFPFKKINKDDLHIVVHKASHIDIFVNTVDLSVYPDCVLKSSMLSNNAKKVTMVLSNGQVNGHMVSMVTVV